MVAHLQEGACRIMRPNGVRTDTGLLLLLYGGAIAISCASVAYFRIEWPRAEEIPFLSQTPVILLGISLLVGAVVLFQLIRSYRLRKTTDRAFQLTMTLGLVTIVATFLCAELAVRLLTTKTPEGPSVLDTMLLPRDWPLVMAHRRLLWERSASRYGVFRFDDMLGWTVGSNRQGTGPHGETYYSSYEGLRAGGPDIALADQALHKIALLGDSYTFASDVSYEDSWGYRLERKLGPSIQVLNFGVPGYGVDQAYLRYERDVRAWHPDVVMLSVISHDVLRTTMVYYQIGFPGALVPGAKPRLIIRDGRLVPVNLPLPDPQTLLSSDVISQIPFVEFDRSYRISDWNWQPYQWSYLFRFAVSWTPSRMQSDIDADTLELNRVILQTFVRRVQEDGAIPVILFLPSFTDFRDVEKSHRNRDVLGLQVLDYTLLPFVNALACLDHLPSWQQLFTTGWHYTAQGNELIAQCMHDVVRGQKSISTRLSGRS